MIASARGHSWPGRSLKTAATAGATTLLAVIAAGCAGGSGGSGTRAPPAASFSAGSPSAASVKATPSPTATILTGTTLNTLLLPASAMPAGFVVDTPGSRNSVSAVAPDQPAPLPAGQVCPRLAGTAWIDTAGLNGASFAQNDYVDTGHTEEVMQEIDAFHGADAESVMGNLWHVFSRCRSFTYQYSGMTVTTTVTRALIPGAGDEGIKAILTSPSFQGGQTLAAVRVGNTIITTSESMTQSDVGAGAVTMAETIAAKVKAAGG